MKLYSLTTTAAFAVAAVVSLTTVSATECTLKDAESIGSLPTIDFKKTCPPLAASTINFNDFNTITVDSLEAVSACQAPTCLSELESIVATLPDCSTRGVNLYSMFRATLELCEAFSVGDVSVDDARVILSSMISDLGIVGDETGGEADSTTTTEEPETETPETEKPATKAPETKAPATAETPVATTRDPSLAVTTSPPTPTTAPTPVPTSTPTSHASATTIVGVSVVTTATLVASLLL